MIKLRLASSLEEEEKKKRTPFKWSKYSDVKMQHLRREILAECTQAFMGKLIFHNFTVLPRSQKRNGWRKSSRLRFADLIHFHLHR